MTMPRNAGHRGEAGRPALRLWVALAMVGAGLGPALADPTDATGSAGATDATEAAGAAGAVVGNETIALKQEWTRSERKGVSPLDRRVMLLTRELGLNATQRAQVKKVLESQREQVARVWNDASIPPAMRVSATQAIGDRTADRIRALLNEEQRKKYIKPRKRDAAVGTAGGDVERWMSAGQRR